MNICMMATPLGGAASETLPDGRVVSGVGGQYNFVSMAADLPEARSVLMLHAAPYAALDKNRPNISPDMAARTVCWTTVWSACVHVGSQHGSAKPRFGSWPSVAQKADR